jgi:hypothetical protein
MLKKSLFMVLALVLIIPAAVFGADKLIVQDGSSVTQFVVQDSGTIGVKMPSPLYQVDVNTASTSVSALHFTSNGADSGGYITTAAANNFFLSSNAAWGVGGWIAKGTSAVAVGTGGLGYRVFLSNACTAGAICHGLDVEKFKVDYSGNVTALSFNPTSTRDSKDNIQNLSAKSATDALNKLEPVTFTYKLDPDRNHVGFIAEDVPELVASKDRKTLNTMDIVGVLTKVVKEQKQTIDDLAATVSKLEAKLNRLESKDMSAQK